MSYEYSDFVKCHNILEAIKKNYEVKHIDMSDFEGKLLYIRNQNIIRGLTDCQFLLGIEADKVINLINSEEYQLLSKIKKDIDDLLPVNIPSEIKEDLIEFTVEDVDFKHRIHLRLTEDKLHFYLFDSVQPLPIDYKITVAEYEADRQLSYTNIILRLLKLVDEYTDKIDTVFKFKLEIIRDCYDFIKNRTDITEKINTRIDFGDKTLDFDISGNRLYVGINYDNKEIVIVNAPNNYSTVYRTDIDNYNKNKEQFYKDLYTIISTHFGAALEEGKLNDI